MGMGWRELIGVGVWGVLVGYSQPPLQPPTPSRGLTWGVVRVPLRHLICDFNALVHFKSCWEQVSRKGDARARLIGFDGDGGLSFVAQSH